MDVTTEQKPMFGSLTPSEAGRRAAESKRRKKAEDPITDEEAMIAAMMRKAKDGDPRAANVLMQLGVIKPKDRSNDQGLLALLTPQQRDCIEAHLRGQVVTPDQAIAAWCSKED